MEIYKNASDQPMRLNKMPIKPLALYKLHEFKLEFNYTQNYILMFDRESKKELIIAAIWKNFRFKSISTLNT